MAVIAETGEYSPGPRRPSNRWVIGNTNSGGSGFAACLEVRVPYIDGMIKRLLLAALCLFSTAGSLAQMRVELSFEQETYLPREPLYALVTVYNSSGQTLALGADNEWLSFAIESVDGRIVKDLKPAEVQGEFTLPSAHRAKKMINLADAFDLTKFGRYKVTAMVRVAGWNETFSSTTRSVGITSGVVIWEANCGVPSEKPDGRPEIRKYQLVQANHLKALSLYVRIMDEGEQEVLSLYPLGPLLGVSKPNGQVDRWSNVHVLYQDGARSFRYSMITPDGLLLARQTWEVGDEGIPGLRRDSEGRISVAGGSRRFSAKDLPPPELLTEKSTPEPEPPAVVAEPTADATKTK